ncbi:MAG TPA: DUF4403 family protein [Nitrospiraceae bacterium]|nr:DUF4403 family protein [Nitrospiraceae bacterium]
MKYFNRSLTLLLPLLIVAGCSHTIPTTDRMPQPPPQIGKVPPTIAPLSASGKQAQASESILPVTLSTDLTPVQRAIQASVPERFSDVDQPFTNPLANDYRWQFVREGQPEVSIQDGLVKYQAVYRGEIESRATRACRLDPLFPVLEGTGRLMLREQDQGLFVMMDNSQMSITLKPESDSKCNMFNSAVNDQLAELFRQEVINKQISQSVESYSIPIQLVWDRLQEPMAVGQANSQLCLYGRAQDFIVGSFKGPAHQTTITGVARETPMALFQTPCQKSPATAPLKVHMDNTAVATQEGQSYKVLLTVPVPYAVLTQQLQDKLFHQEMKLATTFSNSLTIERVMASDVSGRSLFSVETSGAVSGTLYYWGTPRLEHEGNVITIPDLQMANETKIALDEVKAGYWQMVDAELGPRLRQAATIDLARRIGNMKTALSGQHKSGGLAMDLLMGRQEAGQVSSTKDALVADVLLEGTASATGRVPVQQQPQSDTIERTRSMHAPADNAPEKAARRQEEQRASEDFSKTR